MREFARRTLCRALSGLKEWSKTVCTNYRVPDRQLFRGYFGAPPPDGEWQHKVVMPRTSAAFFIEAHQCLPQPCIPPQVPLISIQKFAR